MMSTVSKRCFVFALGLMLSGLAGRGFSQVVQLPAYRTFSYSGSAWVPDAGTASLGGNYGAASSSISRGVGPYSPRATSSIRGGVSVSASVTIIDLDALDEAMLNAQPAGSALGVDAGADPLAAPRMAGVGRNIINAAQRYHGGGVPARINPNAYRRALAGHTSPPKQAAVESLVEDDVRYYLMEGQKAERAGRIISARVYYQMAMESMTPEMIERYQSVVRKREEARKEALASQDSVQAGADTTNQGRVQF